MSETANEHVEGRAPVVVCISEKEIKINSKILKENGCVEPLKGKKSKCVLKIVPENDKCDTFQINVN